MSPHLRAIAAALWLAGLATGATAQQTAPSPAASAASSAPAASPTPARGGAYRSAFEGYKTFNEQPVLSWRESNNVVGRIGGWQAYAREGQGGPTAAGGDTSATPSDKAAAPAMPAPAPMPKAKPAAAPASASMPGGHTGHQKP